MHCIACFVSVAIVSTSATADAAITRIAFTGSGVVDYNDAGTYQGEPIAAPDYFAVGDPVSIDGELTFADGSDPGGPPAVPDDFTGRLRLERELFVGSAGFIFYVNPGLMSATTLNLGDPPAFAGADIELVGGRLISFNLFTTRGRQVDILTSNSFQHFVGSARFGGTWRLDTAAVPEPASWALMIVGFGLVGTTSRTARARTA